MRRLWMLVAVAGIAAIALGLSRGEWGAVSDWAHTLCTSCVGLSGGQ